MSEDPDDLERFRWTCPRSLSGHGNRSAAEMLAEIPADAGIDRYGVGDLTVGDATLELEPGAIARIVDRLVNGARGATLGREAWDAERRRPPGGLTAGSAALTATGSWRTGGSSVPEGIEASPLTGDHRGGNHVGSAGDDDSG